MVTTNLFETKEDRKVICRRGVFSVIEYQRDLSIAPDRAVEAYFASEMNVRKKQLAAEITDEKGVYVQGGAMQLMIGQIKATTDIKGVGDFFKKAVKASVTRESIVKTLYFGNGTLVLEPTFRYILLVDVGEWKEGMVIEDGMFLASDESVDITVTSRKNLSSIVFGREGIFNSLLTGEGIVALESPVPEEELIVLDLEDDVVKIDGDMAIAWSNSLKFTTEKTTSTLIGSFASGEGFVNVFEGTGRILIAPVRNNYGITVPEK